MMPRAIEHHQLAGAMVRRHVRYQRGLRARVQQGGAAIEMKLRSKTFSVVDQQLGICQGPVHDPRGVERMKALADVLQDQHPGLVFDAGNCRAKTIRPGPEATVTPVSSPYTCNRIMR
jgi:hypothetical protein